MVRKCNTVYYLLLVVHRRAFKNIKKDHSGKKRITTWQFGEESNTCLKFFKFLNATDTLYKFIYTKHCDWM